MEDAFHVAENRCSILYQPTLATPEGVELEPIGGREAERQRGRESAGEILTAAKDLGRDARSGSLLTKS